MVVVWHSEPTLYGCCVGALAFWLVAVCTSAPGSIAKRGKQARRIYTNSTHDNHSQGTTSSCLTITYLQESYVCRYVIVNYMQAKKTTVLSHPPLLLLTYSSSATHLLLFCHSLTPLLPPTYSSSATRLLLFFCHSLTPLLPLAYYLSSSSVTYPATRLLLVLLFCHLSRHSFTTCPLLLLLLVFVSPTPLLLLAYSSSATRLLAYYLSSSRLLVFSPACPLLSFLPWFSVVVSVSAWPPACPRDIYSVLPSGEFLEPFYFALGVKLSLCANRGGGSFLETKQS